MRFVAGISAGVACLLLVVLTVFVDSSRSTLVAGEEPRSDLALVLGHDEYGSFLTTLQKSQLDKVLQAYRRGDFFDIYVAAPASIAQGNRIPFAMAEYLVKGGMPSSRVLIDDDSSNVLQVFAKLARLMDTSGYSSPLVYAAGIDMPKAKMAAHKSRISDADFVTTEGVLARKFNTVAWTGALAEISKEAAAVSSVYIFAPSPTHELAETADHHLKKDLLFKPLQQINDPTDALAWNRIRFSSEASDHAPARGSLQQQF